MVKLPMAALGALLLTTQAHAEWATVTTLVRGAS